MSKRSLGCLSTLFIGLLALIPGSGTLAIIIIVLLLGAAAVGWDGIIILFVVMGIGEYFRLRILEKQKEKKEREKREKEEKFMEEVRKRLNEKNKNSLNQSL